MFIPKLDKKNSRNKIVKKFALEIEKLMLRLCPTNKEGKPIMMQLIGNIHRNLSKITFMSILNIFNTQPSPISMTLIRRW